MERILTSAVSGKIGETISMSGWVHARRDHGKIIFIDLRDKDGLVQVVFIPKEEEAYKIAETLRPEWVVKIEGVVNKRPDNMINPNLTSGTVEMLASKIEVISEAQTPPFELDKNTMPVNEELRLKYRYLDLRSERLHTNMVMRHKVIKFFRDFLDKEGFLEIETPILSATTPEGARDFIVPSRLQPGKFYALPQAPQQYKQLLMVAGIEKYFQVARCFRDEDQRGDRQPEFTQLDMEMSFVDREDVMSLVERLMIETIQNIAPSKKIQDVPFPRISYKEAMEKYGTDRPDLRSDKDDPDLLAFCWVIDFPFFERGQDGNWTFTHNPFSSAKKEHHEWLMNKENIDQILTDQYDIVLNGYEVGGGSIRNHDAEALRKVFEIMGYEKERINKNFRHMLEAFSYGAPPHGGIAPGVDRLVMILQNEPNIREVMAFPKTGDARDPMMGAPSEIPDAQLKEANIKIR